MKLQYRFNSCMLPRKDPIFVIVEYFLECWPVQFEQIVWFRDSGFWIPFEYNAKKYRKEANECELVPLIDFNAYKEALISKTLLQVLASWPWRRLYLRLWNIFRLKILYRAVDVRYAKERKIFVEILFLLKKSPCKKLRRKGVDPRWSWLSRFIPSIIRDMLKLPS